MVLMFLVNGPMRRSSFYISRTFGRGSPPRHDASQCSIADAWLTGRMRGRSSEQRKTRLEQMERRHALCHRAFARPAEQALDLGDRTRLADQIALGLGAALAAEQIELRVGLDALRGRSDA